MKNLLLLISILSLILAGCSSIKTIENFPSKKVFYGNFNNFAKDKKVDLLLKKDSLITNQSEVAIKDDSIYSMENKNIAPLQRLKSVSYKNKLRGSLYGLLIGAISGLAVTYTISNFINRNNSDKRSSENGYIALSGIPIGAIVGIIWGWLSGYNYVYQFNK